MFHWNLRYPMAIRIASSQTSKLEQHPQQQDSGVDGQQQQPKRVQSTNFVIQPITRFKGVSFGRHFFGFVSVEL